MNEILVNTSKVRKVIAEEAGNAEKLYDLIETGEGGSITFEQFMLDKVNEGVLDFDVAYRASSRKEFFDAVKAGEDPVEARKAFSETASSAVDASTPETLPQPAAAENKQQLPAPEPFEEEAGAGTEPEQLTEPEESNDSFVEMSDIGEPVSRYGVYYHQSGSEVSILGDQFQDFIKNRKPARPAEKKKPPLKRKPLDLNLTEPESLIASFPKRNTKPKE